VRIPTRQSHLTAPEGEARLRIDSVTASEISLAWDASTDDTGIAEYQVSVSPHEGNLLWTGETSVKLVGLAPLTEYTFIVKARDFGYNLSPGSIAVSATTEASTDTDAAERAHEPPTDPQFAIRYRIFINGVLDPIFIPIGTGETIAYGMVDGLNTFVLRAVDSAGNVSAPSNSVPLDVNIC
jgi:hypothetical protein